MIDGCVRSGVGWIGGRWKKGPPHKGLCMRHNKLANFGLFSTSFKLVFSKILCYV